MAQGPPSQRVVACNAAAGVRIDCSLLAKVPWSLINAWMKASMSASVSSTLLVALHDEDFGWCLRIITEGEVGWVGSSVKCKHGLINQPAIMSKRTSNI